MPDVVHRAIAPPDRERRLAGAGRRVPRGKMTSKTMTRPPSPSRHTPKFRANTSLQRVARRGVSLDGEADRGGRARVGAAPHAPPERVAEHASDQRQLAPATGHVQRLDRLVAHQGGHGADGLLDQRPAALVVGGHGDRDLPPAVAARGPGRRRSCGCSGGAPPSVAGTPRAAGRARAADNAPRGTSCQRHVRQQLVEIVAAEGGDPLAGHDGVGLLVELHQRGVEGAAPQVVDEHAGP